MNLQRLDNPDRAAYDHFVTNHHSGDFLQSWDWGEWQEKLGKTVSRFFVTETDTPVLAASVIQTPVPYLGGYYLYLPHGPLLAAGAADQATAVMNFFITQLRQHSPKSRFIRIEPTQQLWPDLPDVTLKKTVNIQAGKTLVLDLNRTEIDLLSSMHPKTRYNIKVAQKHGVHIQQELVATPRHGLYLPEVVRLIVATAQRQRYKGYPEAYYKGLIDHFGTQGETITLSIYKALYQDQLLTGAIMIDFGQSRSYLFGGSSTEHRNVMAPYLLHWQAIADAKAKGYQLYDFGGSETAAGKQNLGFSRFKLGFGTREVVFPGTYDVVLHPAWYTIYTALRQLNRARL